MRPLPPVILTLALDDAAERFFQEMRTRWFPPALNLIPAHVTMFHHLPGETVPGLMDALGAACAGETNMPVGVTGLRHLGRGVAYTLQAPAAEALRGRLAARWQADLTAQDRQGWRPHVTIQNKVDPTVSRALHAALSRDFVPFAAMAVGVRAWRYLGGPWERVAFVPFGAA
jgi:hypothetical protein